MRSLYLIIFAISFCTLKAQTPVLVKDINPGPLGSAVANFPHIQIDDVIYFVGDISGKRDLYSIKDGEVQMISQLCSGSCSFFEVFFLRFQNKLLFVKRIDSKFNQLWSTDGTVSGTSMILDYPGAFRSFGVGNNGKVYLSLYNRNSFKDEVYISDGTEAGTKKLSTDVSLGFYEEQFGAPIKYENGIAFANITNDSLKLFTYDDEKLSLLNAVKVSSGAGILGLKSIYTDDIVILVHSDNAKSSDLYKYDFQSKSILKEISLPFNNQLFPYLKDFSNDSLVLYYYSGGHFLLTGRPLKTSNITNFSSKFFSSNDTYYAYQGVSAFLTKDENASFGQVSKFVLFDGDPSAKKISIVENSNSPSIIGFTDYAFYGIDDPVYKSGEISMFNLKNKTTKQVLKFNQSFSSNQIKLLGLLGSKLYFLANLNQTFGKELYFVETGIPTSTQEITSETSFLFKLLIKGNVFKLESDKEFAHPLNVELFDISGRLIKHQLMNINTDYYIDQYSGGYYFARISDQNKIHLKSILFVIP